MINRIEQLIKKAHSKYIWDEQPVFSFTSDIDWASEAVMKKYCEIVNPLNLKPTLFVTHHSDQIETNYIKGLVERALHPNFMNGSSHGNSFKEVAETCMKFAPEAFGFRSHRAFDVTDITHLMHNEYGFKYVSHQITVFQPSIKPILHESGLINFPIFFEDGTHLYNKLDLNFLKYKDLFFTPGIKVVSFHPMNFVFNSPALTFMRNIKDSMSREDYNNINEETIKKHENTKTGIRDTVLGIIEFVKRNNFTMLSMNDLYHTFMEAGV
jgi:hypothetical protein